ncbi:MAG: metal-dependent transcriptional regulator [Candidatus Heimdallarchaeota archaeon]|nr:metal-dependent transcriptional regulator [Candidatus Heimdallarchaeota archaeon]
MSEAPSETEENYLKQIYLLTKLKGKARVSDIAKDLDKQLSTVTGAVQRLAEKGWINYQPYKHITLTEEGMNVAKGILKHFEVLYDLLITIGVEEDQANIDACSMEHISDETILKISSFLATIKEKNPR